MPDAATERSLDSFGDLADEEDVLGDLAVDEDTIENLDQSPEEEAEEQVAPDVVTDPDQIESGSSKVEFVAPTGRFNDAGQPLKVPVTLSIPDDALDLAAQYIAYQTKARAELLLWQHFVEGPEWLVEPERHGIYYEGDDYLVHPSKRSDDADNSDYHQTFTEEEKERHEEKLHPATLRKRVTQKIQLVAGVDGDFIKDRLERLPSDVRQQAEKSLTGSQKGQDSDQSESGENGQTGNEPSSSST